MKPDPSARRASVFVSHKIATHAQAARRIKALLESRSERLDIHICEDLAGGERWRDWIATSIAHSRILLVLWPRGENLARDWISEEIGRFKVACPAGRLVVLKSPGDPIPDIVREFQVINAHAESVTEGLLRPLYCDVNFTGLEVPLNGRVSVEDLTRDAEEITDTFMGRRETRSERFIDVLRVDVANVDVMTDLHDAQVQSPDGCRRTLNWTRTSFSWRELREKAEMEKGKGTFWLREMEQAMQDVAQSSTPRVMSSTFRGRGPTAGQIFRPQIERVHYAGDRPVRFCFALHEVLAPELVRGRGEVGDVFNLLHVATRVRWEVLNPFLVKRLNRQGAAPDTGAGGKARRNEVIGEISSSLRVIELEAERHGMLSPSVLDAFEGEDRESLARMLKERESLRSAITSAVEADDYDRLMQELASALELNCAATELLAQRFAELVQEDRAHVQRLLAGESR